MVENVRLLAIVCKFLCIVSMKSLQMSEKRVTMGRILVSVSGVP